jgi:hypothetical protein
MFRMDTAKDPDPIKTWGQASRWSLPALKGGNILGKERTVG